MSRKVRDRERERKKKLKKEGAGSPVLSERFPSFDFFFF